LGAMAKKNKFGERCMVKLTHRVWGGLAVGTSGGREVDTLYSKFENYE